MKWGYMMMLSLVIMFVTLFVTYIITVFSVKQFCKTDTITARNKVVAFIKESLGYSNKVIEEIYPVFIGIDEFGNPHSDIIEKEFQKLKQVFAMFYFYNFVQYENNLLYQFKASEPTKELENWELIEYISKLVDALVHEYIHKNNPMITHINFLVAVNYVDDILSIYIAKNNSGTLLNKEFVERLRKSLKDENLASHDEEIIESW